MKNFIHAICAIFIVATLFTPHSAQASHLKGGDTYFVCVGNGQYELVFSCYYACEPNSIAPDPNAADFSWTVTSSCGTMPATITAATATAARDVPLYCPGVLTQCDYGFPYSNAPANAPTGTLVITYTSAPFSIPAGCTVSATMFFSARNAAISNLTNPASYGINITTTITAPTGGGCNNNPLFASYPVNVFCVNKNANFSQAAIDINGDSLVYTLINPQTSGGLPVPFVAGCTPSDPLGVQGGTGFASYFKFDSTTGNINFTPTATGDYVLAVQVNAYHSGVLVGTTMRDIQFTVVTCTSNNNAPILTQPFTIANVTGATVLDSTHIGVCPGEQVSINLVSTDPDSFNYVIDSTNVLQSLPGSSYTVTNTTGPIDTSILHILWTPTGADSGYHYFIVSIRDTSCPTPGRNTYSFIVSVLSGVYAGPNQVYCNGGQPVTIYATGANHYLWTDSATGGPPVGVLSYGPDSSYIVVAPGQNTGYVVQGDLLGSCKNRDTVTIVNAPLFSLKATAQDSSICKYTHTQLTATPNPTSVGPFTYSWSPATSVVSPTSGSTPTTSLTQNTLFVVTATAIGGCAIHDSVEVVINGSAPRIFVNTSDNNVCPGDTIQLTTQVFAENLVVCGLVDTCPNNNLLYSVGVSNDTSSTTGGNFGFTNVYCSPFMGSYNSYKAQYLFTRAELNAAGLSSGSVTDISFFVKQLNSTAAYDTFSISMGCTNLDSLTGFVNNLLEVVPPQSGPNAVFPNQGWTPFPFTHYYNWDGASNIIVQVCYTISSSLFSQDDFVSYSTTPYNGSSVIAGDNFTTGINGCSLNNGANLYLVLNTRPNVKFGMCAPNILTYQWTPATLVCDTCPATAVILDSSTNYTLRVAAGICANDTVIPLMINQHLGTAAVTDTTICYGDTVQLGVLLTNPPVSQCVQGYSVSSIPPVGLSGSGTAIAPIQYVSSQGFTGSTDNGTAGPFAIGFNFPFYCQTYTQFYVNSNGWLTFQYPYPATQVSQEYTAQTLPPVATDLNPQKVIELMMGDYNLSNGFGGGGGNVDYFVVGNTPNRILAVQFNDMADVTGTYTTTGEIMLHETSGIIDILISSSTYTGTNHTTGVKDSTGLGTAAPGMNNQSYIVTQPVAWRFTPQFGPSVAVSSSVWSPNLYLSNDSALNPLAYPPTSQTYYVTSQLVLNQFTHPTLCPVHDSVRVNIDRFTSSVAAVPQTICPGDTAQLTFNPNGNTVSTYVWAPAFGLSAANIGNPTASILDTTTYYVTATDNHGCKASDTITINVLPTPHLVLTPDSTICYSDSVQLNFSGSFSSYKWFRVDSVTGARTLVNTGATSIYGHPQAGYVVEVTAPGAQCPYFTNIAYIDSFIRPNVKVDTFGSLSFCVGSHVVLETDQNLTNIQWTPASFGSQTSFAVTVPGTYSYTALDANGCREYSNTVIVTVSPLPVFMLASVKNPICAGNIDTLVVSATPAATITWAGQGAGNSLIINAPGTYTVQASLNGCVNDTSIIISGAPSPLVSLPASYSTCAFDTGVSATVTGGLPPYSYVWSNGGTGPSTIDSIVGSSQYSVTVTDANNCTAASNQQTITVQTPVVTVAVLPVSDTIFIRDTAVFTATPPAGSNYGYLWSSGTTTTIIAPTTISTGVIGDSLGVDTVYLLVTDAATGCTYKTNAIIHVVEYGAFAMPTAFTPNGDGRNDYFYPAFNGPNSPAHATAFRIYNRWGQLVYDNPNAPGWDGSYGSKPQPEETYLYFITVEYPDPADPTKTRVKSVEGSFQLLR